MATKSVYSSMCVSLIVTQTSEEGAAEAHAVLKGWRVYVCICYHLHHYSAFMPEWAGVSKVRACAPADVECAGAHLWIIGCNKVGRLL